MKRAGDSLPGDTATAATSCESDDENWVNELELELKLEVKKKPKLTAAPDFPHDVLLILFTFVSVGRVCKAWSLASAEVTRGKLVKSLEQVFDQFAPGDPACQYLGKVIEAELHAHHNTCDFSISKGYRDKARMLLFNLRDVKNDLLRCRMFSGELTPMALVRMKSRDMANPHLVAQRKGWIKERTAEVTRNVRHFHGMVESNMFTCPSCGSNRTQHCQGRRKASADRLCIVVMCCQCPHRWQV
ncbi:hypothetical protein H310_11908 [Aphanomyces invadans]|uniref:TFIIS central domain-containing protein n=1 Tax=Aphanomyces invadans TaxID=157072 RepID=A0A024TJQ8_9STRA|nr:hypothetical protein H310_11908 [Aphanomyces invadans]ETV94229.1 hypothetical protein H310_11908 [Aphanomyces invadans]|eukprot:XP_008876991.1 hypothetical protein H310_11908 [Aphanomyces invadans]